MKKTILPLAALLYVGFLAWTGWGAETEQAGQYPSQLLTFSAAKERQVRTLAGKLKLTIPPEINEFFQAATHGDYKAVTNIFERLGAEYLASYKDPSGKSSAWVPFWQPLTEVESAYGAFVAGGTKYPLMIGGEIIKSIPAGSIYFGGTDSGRGLVTALCESHDLGRPFYTLTQNALSDTRYLEYLREMYGSRIYLPTTNDLQSATDNYRASALLRLAHDTQFRDEPRQVKRGEDLRMVGGQLEADGPVALMSIHARLVKVILEHNPKPEFYLEESYPLDIIYPYLSPHGLIFKLHHEPLPKLTPQMLDADNAFWTKECHSLLGDWLQPNTSLSNVCAFSERVYGKKDWSHFNGDKAYVTNSFATKAFSKWRVSIAGLYQWRLANNPETGDQARLQKETDYAFRQAFALSPISQEVVFRYLDFLLTEKRYDDAVLMVRTARVLSPGYEKAYDSVLSQIEVYRTHQDGKTAR